MAAAAVALVGVTACGAHDPHKPLDAAGTPYRGTLPTSYLKPHKTSRADPAAYGYGAPIASGGGGEVTAYALRRLPFASLQVPFTIVNKGHQTAVFYTVDFRVQVGSGKSALSFSDEVTALGLKPGQSVATSVLHAYSGDLPMGPVQVTLTKVQKTTQRSMPAKGN